MHYKNIQKEEELKSRVGQDYFAEFDFSKIIDNIDFCVSAPNLSPLLNEEQYLLWAEAKKGNSEDIYASFVQLILTVGKTKDVKAETGKAGILGSFSPPLFFAAFDAEKIAFVPFTELQEIFSLNDFNWKVRPSDHKTKEFKLVYDKVKNTIEGNAFLFYFGGNDNELRTFIASNFIVGKSEISKIRIDKHNFIFIYNKWLVEVKPSIAASWELAKKNGIIDGDFFLADLLSRENETLKEKLYVLLKKDHYELDRKIDEMEFFSSKKTSFRDNQKAHTQFWNKYERPPQEEYWDFIVGRRDLLVPKDVRQRKGSFFTPQIWVNISQKYLAEAFGENWQDEYYIWDCAAGTGNLLAGLTKKYRVWASTLDRQDVDVMKDRIKNGANLLENHVFQFDFLNDEFDAVKEDKTTKLPQSLLDIINDPEKRKKLIIYINPPYAEAANYGKSKDGVSSTMVYKKFKDKVSFAVNELFSQFFTRINEQLPSAKLASFSKLKYVTATNFARFRNNFNAAYKKGFVCRANTFDNVTGNFPIAFLIWDLEKKEEIKEVKCDVLGNDGKIEGIKSFFAVKKGNVINDWLRAFYNNENIIGHLRFVGPDFQGNRGVFFTNEPKQSDIKESRLTAISQKNVLQMCMYLSIRHCIESNWLNDRDQFLYPNEKWKADTEFQNDCFTLALFHGQNKITSGGGVNHWIPFTPDEVDSKEAFKSTFMSDFINGKLRNNIPINLLTENTIAPVRETALTFSSDAKSIFAAGLELWKYYHAEEKVNVNASLYDIKAYFQARDKNGRMNNKSEDETYNKLIGELRKQVELLAQKIEPKVYEYGFLKG